MRDASRALTASLRAGRHKHLVGVAIVTVAYAFLVLSDAFCTRGGNADGGGEINAASALAPLPTRRFHSTQLRHAHHRCLRLSPASDCGLCSETA